MGTTSHSKGQDTPPIPLNRFGNRRGMNPNSRKGRFRKQGLEGGNPRNDRGGAPISMVALLKEELKKVPSKALDGKENADKLTNAQLIAMRIVEEAKEGNLQMAKDIVDRCDGKVAVAIGGIDGKAIEIHHQETKVIKPEDIQPALAALIECGAVQVCRN